MNKRELKRKRVIKYFIEAASQIAIEKGIDHITIRNVSDIAGYNSATLYNYFEDLNQLLAFTAINCVSEYWHEISKIDESEKDPLKKYIKVWLTHCSLAFKNPELYNYVLVSNNKRNMYAYMKQYYTIFPDKYNCLSDRVKAIVVESDSQLRDKMYLQDCIDAGYFAPESAENIIEFVYLITDGFMFQVMNNRWRQRDDYSESFIRYMKKFLEQYNISGKPLELV